jgi:hypothetical protein
MSIQHLITIDGNEITEHNRRVSISEEIGASDVDLASGHRRRFYRDNKKTFNFNWTYLPNSQSKTVDSRKGQTYLSSIANGTSSVTLGIKLDPVTDEYQEFECFVESYSEKLLRRDFSSQCSYFDVNLVLKEK